MPVYEVRYADGSQCGHGHRTDRGALRCLHSLWGTHRQIGAVIIDTETGEVQDHAALSMGSVLVSHVRMRLPSRRTW